MNSYLRKGILLPYIIGSCILCAGCATIYNPATQRREFIVISTDQEVSMGRNIHREVANQYRIVEDEAAQRVKRIGQKLAQVSDRQDYAYHFFVVNSKEINAFTTPGGNIYFFSGLLNKLKTDDEIAAVLAHEIGHCAARHTVKKYQAGLSYSVITSIIFSQLGMSEEAQATTAKASNLAMQLAMSAYGRQDEYQADALGVKYMYLAGYNLDGMIHTLETLERESKDPGTLLILRTHPFVEDRIKMAREEIKEAPTKYGQKAN